MGFCPRSFCFCVFDSKSYVRFGKQNTGAFFEFELPVVLHERGNIGESGRIMRGVFGIIMGDACPAEIIDKLIIRMVMSGDILAFVPRLPMYDVFYFHTLLRAIDGSIITSAVRTGKTKT